MNIRKLLHVLPIIFFVLPNIGYSSDLIQKDMLSGSLKREYFLHVPSGYRPDLALPIVFVLHGGGGHAERIAKFSGFKALSEKHDFLAIYPQAIEKHWNDGRESEKFREHIEKVDDVAWIEKLITELKKTHSVNEKRIYATGISNGGIFAQRLAIELSHHFAAPTSITAKIAEPLAKATPTDPISILLMNGTKDPIVPYGGGEVTPDLFPRLNKLMKRPSRGKVISTDATIEFWIRHNGIEGKGSVTNLPDLDTTDDSTVEHTEWSNKNTGVSVMLYRIIGGGHTWPGAKQYLPVRTIGQTNHDINASEIIWEFFSQHPKY